MAKAELKKKFEDVAKLEEVVAELKVQNQQFTNKRDAAVDKLVKSEMLITELRDREARSKMLAIAKFKSSSDFQEAVENVASEYFGEGFDFCKRQIRCPSPQPRH